jgi:hypothetical protein
MKHCRCEGPLDQIHERELDNMKNMIAHKELGVAAAMDYCAEERICPPQWLVLASAELMRDLLTREKSQKRGRAAGHIARYRQDLWDIERWDAVVEVRFNQKRIRARVERARAHPGYPEKALKLEEKMLAWIGRTWLRAYECAAMTLNGRDARVGTDAIKASYCRVKRNFDNPAMAMRYHLLDQRFLRKLGFEGLSDRKPGVKSLPLYDLTL